MVSPVAADRPTGCRAIAEDPAPGATPRRRYQPVAAVFIPGDQEAVVAVLEEAMRPARRRFVAHHVSAHAFDLEGHLSHLRLLARTANGRAAYGRIVNGAKVGFRLMSPECGPSWSPVSTAFQVIGSDNWDAATIASCYGNCHPKSAVSRYYGRRVRNRLSRRTWVRMSAIEVVVHGRSDAMGSDLPRRYTRHSTLRPSHPLKALYMLRNCAQIGAESLLRTRTKSAPDE